MTTELAAGNTPPLAGLRVLVVEDDYFIADEICSTLRAGGAEVLGPAPDIERGLDVVKNERLDCAVLDINLHGALAFNLADELRKRGTPSIFATGYDHSVLPGTFRDSVRLEKPVNLSELLRAVQSACTRAEPRHSGREH